MNSKYRLYIVDSSQERLVDLSALKMDLSFNKARNRAGQIKFTADANELNRYLAAINTNVRELFAVNRYELHLYRYNKLEIAGQIDYYTLKLDSQKFNVTVYASTWLTLLGYRITGHGQAYSGEDMGAIMWDLIDTTQNVTNGDLGITQGAIQTSRNADRTYDYKNIKDALIQLSEVEDSPDFEITADKVFNVYYPKQGIRRSDIVFTYPGNVIELGYEQDGSLMFNKVYANGAGEDYSLLQSDEDLTSQTSYGLREKVFQYPDVIETTTLDEHATEELSTRSGLLYFPSLTLDGSKDPQYGYYNIGDEVLFKTTALSNVLKPMIGYLRIEEMNVSVNADDSEIVNLSVVTI